MNDSHFDRCEQPGRMMELRQLGPYCEKLHLPKLCTGTAVSYQVDVKQRTSLIIPLEIDTKSISHLTMNCLINGVSFSESIQSDSSSHRAACNPRARELSIHSTLMLLLLHFLSLLFCFSPRFVLPRLTTRSISNIQLHTTKCHLCGLIVLPSFHRIKLLLARVCHLLDRID